MNLDLSVSLFISFGPSPLPCASFDRSFGFVTAVSEDNTTLTVERGNAAGSEAVLDFDVTRPRSFPAIPDPAYWHCHPSKYMDGERCDCECGMADPDCLTGTAELFHCNVLNGEVCSPLGRCTVPFYSAGTVAVSQPCRHLLLPGETALFGYLGSEEQYRAAGGAGCAACPHDPQSVT